MHFSFLMLFVFPLVTYCRTLRSLSCTCKYPCPQAVGDCEFGLVEDDCDCCDKGICAKGLNQDCGGKWNHAGKCAATLTCELVFPRFTQLPGVCKPNPKAISNALSTNLQ